jgi:hypothetical protein
VRELQDTLDPVNHFLEDKLPEVLKISHLCRRRLGETGLSNSSHTKEGGGAPIHDAKLAVARSETAKDQWSVAYERETFRKERSVQPPSFTIPWQKDFGGFITVATFLLSTTLAFRPFLRS